MKRLALVVSSLLTSGLCGWSQGVEPLAPSAVTPKTVESRPAKARTAERPKSPRSPEGDKPLIPTNPTLTIKGIVIVKSLADIQENGVPSATGIVVRDIPFLAGWPPKGEKPFLGSLLTEN